VCSRVRKFGRPDRTRALHESQEEGISGVADILPVIHRQISELSVYKCILEQFRARIRARRYVMTVHAEEEMDDDNLSIAGKLVIIAVYGR
jgi:hypothetical protein